MTRWHIQLKDFDFDNILKDKKSQKNALIYDISCRKFIGPKQLHNRFDKINEFIMVYDKSRYFVLFCLEKILCHLQQD